MTDLIEIIVTEAPISVSVSVTEAPIEVDVTVVQGIGEAPVDGETYGRKDGDWSIVVSDTVESDPVFLASPAAGISSGDISSWNAMQAYDATLSSIAGLGTAADKMIYTTGIDTWVETTITAAGRSLLDDATTGDMLTTLGAAASGHTHAQLHDALTLGLSSNGLSLAAGQVLSLGLASAGVTGALSGTDWSAFNSKQAALTLPLSAANGGTGVANTGTITNASNTTITGGGTVALGGFTLTVPATGTAALLATANVFTAAQTISVSAFGNIDLVRTGGVTGTIRLGVSPTNGFIIYDAVAAASRFSIDGSGNITIGGTGSLTMAGGFTLSSVTGTAAIASSTYPVVGSTRNSSATAVKLAVNELLANSTGDMADGFGPFFVFGIKDTAAVNNSIADLGAIREGNDTSGKLQFGTYLSGVYGTSLTLSSAGLAEIFARTTTTNAVKETMRIQAYVSTAATGGANGFGTGLSWYAETATDGTNQQQGLISTSWIDATNASRKAKLSLSAYDTAARLGMEIEASGTAAKLAFYGGTTVVRGAALTTQLTTITHTAPTPDYAIQNLTNVAPFGFVTADEGNTVLSVIANLQVRVAELEARLGSATGINIFA